MFMKFSFVVVGFFTIFTSAVYAKDLEVESIYRLGMTVENLKEIGNSDKNYTALKNSKFQVIDMQKDGSQYIIQFTKIYKSKNELYASVNWVIYEKAYILPKQIETVDITNVSKISLTGLSAGPLIVPFKFRLNDKSLSGDAEVGVYAGVTFEPGCTKSNWCFRITPLVSAGISQVSVMDGTGVKNRSAATIAAGFLITNWANLNIGLIYGQDRIGDSDWEHEGKGWLSFMIGWQL